jgi:hypothetical protein
MRPIKQKRGIPLKTGRGIRRMLAWVDAEDFPRVKKFSYHASAGCGTYYARRAFNNIGLHRDIMGESNIPKGFVVHHINENGLDNRKKNLKIIPHSENIRLSRRRFGK